MKIIHCADLHLDSPLKGLTASAAAERRNELLEVFKNMTEYAQKHNIGHIIIAGDLFDKNKISAAARGYVLNLFRKYPEICFYYLKGNHDNDFMADNEQLPGNLMTFGSSWTEYRIGELGNISISGVETDSKNYDRIANLYMADAGLFNIVVLHGQETDGDPQGPDSISIRSFRNKGIDYMALGHIHSYKLGRLDGRGAYCYPGCLEARGFDECGEHGFVVLDIDENTKEFKTELVRGGYRYFHEINVDISECDSDIEILSRIKGAISASGIPAKDAVKIYLVGETELETEINTVFLEQNLEDEFYVVRVKNKSVKRIDYNAYAYDETMKGEFVRLVLADTTLSEDEKAAIIVTGIKVLKGEKVG